MDDTGAHRLIEMLEERFGKRWADLLLLCVVAGMAAWGINASFVYIFVPLFKFGVVIFSWISGIKIHVPSTLGDIVARIVEFLSVAIGIIAGSALYSSDRRVMKMDKQLKVATETVNANTALLHENIQAISAKVPETIKNMNALMTKEKEYIRREKEYRQIIEYLTAQLDILTETKTD